MNADTLRRSSHRRISKRLAQLMVEEQMQASSPSRRAKDLAQAITRVRGGVTGAICDSAGRLLLFVWPARAANSELRKNKPRQRSGKQMRKRKGR